MAVGTDSSANYLRRTSVFDMNAAYTWMGWVALRADRDAHSNLLMIGESEQWAYDSIKTTNAGDGLSMACTGPGGDDYGSDNFQTMTVGTYYHAAMVRSSATDLRLYIDGAWQKTITISVAARNAANDMRVCGSTITQASYWAQANVSCPKLWTVALSADEVLREMRWAAPKRLRDLWGWWRLRPNGTVNDLSGNGRNWTEVGTVADVADAAVSVGASSGLWMPAAVAAAGTTILPHMMQLSS